MSTIILQIRFLSRQSLPDKLQIHGQSQASNYLICPWLHFYREEVAGLVPGAWSGFACAAAVTAAMYLAEVHSYICTSSTSTSISIIHSAVLLVHPYIHILLLCEKENIHTS